MLGFRFLAGRPRRGGPARVERPVLAVLSRCPSPPHYPEADTVCQVKSQPLQVTRGTGQHPHPSLLLVTPISSPLSRHPFPLSSSPLSRHPYLVTPISPDSYAELPFEWPESPAQARNASKDLPPAPIVGLLKKKPWLAASLYSGQVPSADHAAGSVGVTNTGDEY